MPSSINLKVCSYCGGQFPPTKAWRRFCSPQCKNAARSAAIKTAANVHLLIEHVAAVHQSIGEQLESARKSCDQIVASIEEATRRYRTIEQELKLFINCGSVDHQRQNGLDGARP